MEVEEDRKGWYEKGYVDPRAAYCGENWAVPLLFLQHESVETKTEDTDCFLNSQAVKLSNS